MIKRNLIKLGAVGTLGLALLTGVVACGDTSNIVDGKAIVEVPLENGGVSTCYLLEINRETMGEEESAEDYFCVSRAEYDRNRLDQPWVDANGNEK